MAVEGVIGYPGRRAADLQRARYRAALKFSEEVKRAAARGISQAVQQDIERLAASLNTSIRNGNLQEAANKELAANMRTALVQAYESTVEARKRTASYRIGQNRYAGGALRRALASPSMAVGTKTGIKYLDQDKLNATARQWARLNFGAGQLGGETVQRKLYSLRFEDATLGRVGVQSGARPAFFMPIGVWRGQQFFPTSKRFNPKVTRGIAAANFVNAGFAVLAEEFPGRYKQLLGDLVHQAEATNSKTVKNIDA